MAVMEASFGAVEEAACCTIALFTESAFGGANEAESAMATSRLLAIIVDRRCLFFLSLVLTLVEFERVFPLRADCCWPNSQERVIGVNMSPVGPRSRCVQEPIITHLLVIVATAWLSRTHEVDR